MFQYDQPLSFLLSVTVCLRSAHKHRSAARATQADPCRYRAFTTEDYDTYVDNMAENAVWGSQLEAFALSKRLGRPIKIWQANTAVSRGSKNCMWLE